MSDRPWETMPELRAPTWMLSFPAPFVTVDLALWGALVNGTRELDILFTRDETSHDNTNYEIQRARSGQRLGYIGLFDKGESSVFAAKPFDWIDGRDLRYFGYVAFWCVSSIDARLFESEQGSLEAYQQAQQRAGAVFFGLGTAPTVEPDTRPPPKISAAEVSRRYDLAKQKNPNLKLKDFCARMNANYYSVKVERARIKKRKEEK